MKHTKTRILFGAIAVGAALVFCACGKQPTEAAPDYKLAGNDFVDYTFEYPEAWDLVRDDGMIAVKAANENVSISCTSFEPDKPELLVQEYWDGYYESFVKTFGTEPEILEEDETKLGGVPAKTITYRCDLAGETYVFTQVTGVYNGTAYTLTYTATPDTHDTYRSALTHAVTSFQFR